MRELRLTDRDLQALVAPGLRAKLRAAGFKIGRSSGEFPAALFVPISLDLVGWCQFTRDEDGVWTILQDETRMADILDDAHAMHADAVATRAAPPVRS